MTNDRVDDDAGIRIAPLTTAGTDAETDAHYMDDESPLRVDDLQERTCCHCCTDGCDCLEQGIRRGAEAISRARYLIDRRGEEASRE